MRGKQRKTQTELAFEPARSGEAAECGDGGREPQAAKYAAESPASERLMEAVCARENLKKALKRVMSNGGAPGVDGMRTEELPTYLREEWGGIKERLLEGAYKPSPVRRVDIPKPDGGTRKLGIPTVADRLIQQAILQVLQPVWDATFSEHSFGFRPGRSAHQAVALAQQYIVEGNNWVVDIDVEKFFDNVNHDVLMGRVAKRVEDKRLLKLIRAYLNAGMMENGLTSPTDKGTPQGGPLSPLLSNLLLDEFDKELERRGHKFVRYADDCNIYVRSERAGGRVMENITKFLHKKLRLKVNEQKSKVDEASKRDFLGFRFTEGETRKRCISPKAIVRFKKQVRKLTRRTKAVSIRGMVAELNPYLRGWLNYFGFCETPSMLAGLDGWIRRRLRCVIWKQWKRGRVRYAELRRRGIPKDFAAMTAGSAHGPWRLSLSRSMTAALPNAFFYSLCLVSLAAKKA